MNTSPFTRELARRSPISLPIYLYLEKPEFVDTWVNGGKAPIAPASKYLGNRTGIYTPDEVAIVATQGLSGNAERAAFDIARSIGVSNVQFQNVTIATGNESFEVGYAKVEHGRQDSLILSFASILSANLATKLRKKAVVEIQNPFALAEEISKQIGYDAEINRVFYTQSPARDCFLKSREDSWQNEIRMAWFTSDLSEVWVEIPAGFAKEVAFDTLPILDEADEITANSNYDKFREEHDLLWTKINAARPLEVSKPVRRPLLASHDLVKSPNRKERRRLAKFSRTKQKK